MWVLTLWVSGYSAEMKSQWYAIFAGLYLQVCKYRAILKSFVAKISSKFNMLMLVFPFNAKYFTCQAQI